MELKDHVANLSLSNILRMSDVKHESFFYWRRRKIAGWSVMYDSLSARRKDDISAFTVGELGELLPKYVESKKSYNKSGRWCCFVIEGAIDLPKELEPATEFYGSTEANVRAEILIHLIEKGFIKIK